jgi:hypothetical protein
MKAGFEIECRQRAGPENFARDGWQKVLLDDTIVIRTGTTLHAHATVIFNGKIRLYLLRRSHYRMSCPIESICSI